MYEVGDWGAFVLSCSGGNSGPFKGQDNLWSALGFRSKGTRGEAGHARKILVLLFSSLGP